MKTMDQITYRAPAGSTGRIVQTAASTAAAEADRWRELLEPFLRIGRPMGRGYLDFGSRAAFVRWYADAGSPLDWQYALALVGDRGVLTASYALELPSPDLQMLYSGGGLVPVARTGPGLGRDVIAAKARSADVRHLLIPLLAHVLLDEHRVTMPWTEPSLPEAAMWGVISILEIVGDKQPVSFLTYASGSNWDADLPGTFVSFRPGAALVPPDSGFTRLAAALVERFADSPDELREAVSRQGVLAAGDRAGRITRLLTLLPRSQPGTSSRQPGISDGQGTSGNQPVASSNWWTATTSTPVRQAAAGQRVTPPKSDTTQNVQSTQSVPERIVVCPICLGEIENWNTQGYWRYDTGTGKYVELEVPRGLTELQLADHLRGAHIRCPAERQQESAAAHFLPLNYGRFGRPVLLGFVGVTKSGKSHLLASMVSEIVGGELEKRYGIHHNPLDQARHRQYMDNCVIPLRKKGQVLHGTQEDVVEFADAFLLRDRDGQERPVAFFDVAGGDLAQVSATKRFLWIADGLFFVVDPDRLDDGWAEDETFSNVLDVVRESPRPDPASAAIVLTKADKVRFDEPIARWLRSGSEPLNATEFLRESADVYAYLDSRNALALARPYQVCPRTTLHVASPTGASEGEGGVYPRGVRPRRVIRPLAAMLAMTGVLTGPEAGKVGI
jgi:Double-GTPase 2